MGLLNRTNKPLRITGRGAAPAISTLRPVHVEKAAPCMAACACGSDVRDWITTIALRGKIGLSDEEAMAAAWRQLVATNPLPAAMGRICPHPCDAHCSRRLEEGGIPMAVNALERFLGDRALERGWPLPRIEPLNPERGSVGVIGAGPAGLSFAWQMARRGWPVTVYDAALCAGGMLRYGIPPFRLPRAVLDGEIRRLADLGVMFRMGVRVGRDLTIDQLGSRHVTVFLAIGASEGRRLGCPGEEGEGIRTATDLLRELEEGGRPDLGRRVVVVGAGGTGLDAARQARRLGADVVVVERLSDSPVPAELEEARAEGIEVRLGYEVRAFRREDGRLLAVVGADGEIPADSVVLAVAQRPDWNALLDLQEAVRNGSSSGRIAEGFWTGGDVREISIAGAAIRAGREAALAALAERGASITLPSPRPPLAPERMRPDLYEGKPTLVRSEVPPPERLADPRIEVSLGITEEQFFAEVGRCMSCGRCFLCERCWMYCTPGCFQRKPVTEAGQTWPILLATCDGCGKCAAECPCGVLEMR